MLAYRESDVDYTESRENHTITATHTPSSISVTVTIQKTTLSRSEYTLAYEANNAKFAAFDKLRLALGDALNLCTVLCDGNKYPCHREAGHSGAHAYQWHGQDQPITYSHDDPDKMEPDTCKICLGSISTNKGQGWASAMYCADCLPVKQAEHIAKNSCPNCSAPPEEQEVRNYSTMHHDGDVHCTRCGTYIRMFDAG